MIELHRLELRAVLDLALAHQSRGDFSAARAAYLEVLRREPAHFDALHMLGVVAIQTGHYKAAVESIAQALVRRPDATAAHNNMALALVKLGRTTDAANHYEYVAAARPDSLEAHARFAAVLIELGRLPQALETCDRMVALHPRAALPHLTRALVLRSMLRPEEALSCCESAAALEPGSADAWDKYGAAFRDLLRLEEAQACFARAIELRPEFAPAHKNAGMIYLQNGDFGRGWREYEWRKQPGGSVAVRNWSKPALRAQESVSGKTVLVHAEQGYGDTIQFCRYAHLLQAAGANVILAVPPVLCGLMRRLRASIEVCSDKDPPRHFDCHASLLSLPLLFATTLATIPNEVPYLSSDEDRKRRWQQRLGTAGFKIGICWQGSKLPIDVGRSFPLSVFEDIAAIAGVRVISLQKGHGTEQLDSMPKGMAIERLAPDFDSGPDAFLDSAAVIDCLDLVISSDTAVAHLAGALGRSAWLVLQHAPDWRWMLERDDSPWYPHHRLFRQNTRGDWSEVFARVGAALVHRLAAGNGA